MPEAEPVQERRKVVLPAAIAALIVLTALIILYILPVTVAGRVIDGDNQQPVAGALVQLSTGQELRSDASGNFAVRASRLRPVAASVDATGYQLWQGQARFPWIPLASARLDVALQPTVLQGTVVDGASGQPLAGVVVEAGEQAVTTDASGAYRFLRLPRQGVPLVVTADGFIAFHRTLDGWQADGSQATDLRLLPDGLHGVVSDAVTGQPIAAATVRWNDASVASDADGLYYLPQATGGELAISAPGFLSVTVTAKGEAVLQGDEPLDVALQPTVLSGQTLDGRTGAPLAGVTLTAGGQSVTSDDSGAYRFERLHGADLVVEAQRDGYEVARQPVDEVTNLAHGKPLELALLPPHLAGRLVNNVTDQPVAGATVTAGDLSTTSDEDGRFILWTTDVPLAITVEAPGYQPAQAQFDEDVELTVALEPKGLVVTVTDTAGRPLGGAVVTSERSEATADAQGVALLPLIEAGDVFTVTAANYAAAVQTYDGAAQAALALTPDTVIGQAVDAETGEGVLGVTVYVYDKDKCQGIACRGTEPIVYADAAEDGSFEISGLPANPEIMIKAPGYSLYFPEALASGDCAAPYCLTAQMQPFEARGFYVPFHFLYDRKLIESRLDLIEQSPVLNAVVVDMKSDYGKLAWDSQNEIARQIGAYVPEAMTAQEFVQEAQKRGIYTIARFVTFKDDALAEGKPEWALRKKSNPDVLWKDGENLAWVDPYLDEVRQYELDLAKELATLGFDELQFDYFRFTGQRDHNQFTYSVSESTPENRREAITSFSHELMAALKPYGVFTALDVFGSIILNGNEPLIGQNLADMAMGLDYLSPMIYPQVWWPGTFPGCEEPVLCPYKVIRDSTERVREIVSLPTRIRPWLQGYPNNYRTEGPARGYDYDLPEYWIQRQAAEDANAEGWLFWSGGGRFPDEIFGPMPSLAELEAQIRARQGGRSGPY